jgi:hypothetical protein
MIGLLDTVRWVVVWKLEDAKNAISGLFTSKKETIDPFVGESYIQAPVTKKKTVKKKKSKVKRSKG